MNIVPHFFLLSYTPFTKQAICPRNGMVSYKRRVPQVKGHSNVIIERVPCVNTPLARAIRAGDIDPRRDWHILEWVDVDDAARHENAWIAQFRRDRTYRVLNVRRSNQSLLCGYH